MTVKVPTFKFVKVLDGPTQINAVKEYLSKHFAMSERHRLEREEMQKLHADVLEKLASEARMPRDLTPIVDTSYIHCFGTVYIHSAEMDEVDMAAPETVQ